MTTPAASGTLYATVADLRNVLSGTDSGTGTAAQLTDAQLTLALYAASNRVSVYAGNIYDSSSAEATPPPILHDLTLDLACFWAAKTYGKYKAIEPQSPIYLAYANAMQVLNDVRNGRVLLDPAPAPGIGQEVGMVINRIPNVFTGANSNTRLDPRTGYLEPDVPLGQWAPFGMDWADAGGPLYQGLSGEEVVQYVYFHAAHGDLAQDDRHAFRRDRPSGRRSIRQIYAHYQHEDLSLHHPRGGHAKYLEQPLFAHYRDYLATYARTVLQDGGRMAMKTSMEHLSDQVEVHAPILFNHLRRSGHPIVTLGGQPIYDREPKVHRLTEEQLRAQSRLLWPSLPDRLKGWIYWKKTARGRAGLPPPGSGWKDAGG